MKTLFVATRLLFAALLLASAFDFSLAQEEEESGEDVLARQQYFALRRAGGPGRIVPANAFEQAADQHRRMPRDRDDFTSPTALVNWVSVNPTGMFYNRTGANYISGRTNSLAFHPTDPNTFYIGAAGGGVWKTTNGGTSFTVLTDGLTSLTCGALAIDALSPSTIYYGTGEQNYSLDSYYGDGVYKSTDAGATWTKIATAATVGSYISQIVVDPTSSSVVWLSGSNGVYKSTNSGTSWSSTGSGTSANCIIIDPVDPSILYTTTGGYSTNTIKKTTNGGTSWSPIMTGVSASITRTQIAMAPSDRMTLYASAASGSYSLLALYKTTDGGLTWATQAASPNYLGSQGWYDNAVCVKPGDPTFVVTGGIDIYTSPNSGVTLTARTSWSTTTSTNMSHADIHFLGYRGTVLYCGSDGGVYKSTNDGVAWSDLNSTISTLQYQSADYDPTNTAYVHGGTQDNNIERTTNGGTNWIQYTTGDGGYTVVDPMSTNYVYSTYVNGSIKRSSDFGVNYTEFSPSGSTGGLFYNVYEMAPGDPNTIVYGQSDVWKTTSARTATSSSGWTQIATAAQVNGGSGSTNVSSIGISHTDPTRIYIGTSNGKISVTTDNGTSWSTVTVGAYVSDLAVDPADHNIAYATFTGFSASVHVYKTTNGGTSWFTITGDLPNIPTNTVVLRTSSPRTLLVGTDLGVYKSSNEGTNWVSFNSGLPPATVYDLKYKEAIQLLLAATHGRGCWTIDLGAVLPVQLATFTATTITGNRVRLSWTTISEVNNYGFEIEKSFNDQNNHLVIPGSFVPGHGTTSEPQHYVFTDVTASPGLWYYRLKQTDLDGTTHYSGSIRVTVVTDVSHEQLPTAFALQQNYPNPFNPSTTISYDLPKESHVKLSVFNALGQEMDELVNAVQPAGRFTVEFSQNVAKREMSSGVYYYRLEAGNFVQTRKLILAK